MDEKYKNVPKLIETIEAIIENQVREAERENEIQIKRYFDQEKQYVNDPTDHWKNVSARKSVTSSLKSQN